MKQLVSDCCGARPYFALGQVHGVVMGPNQTYEGVCGECKKYTTFNDCDNGH
jgi:hypothetical protein